VSLRVWINGTLYDKENAKISVYDHGLLYGDGVFEGLRSYNGKIFRLEEHLRRLWDSAQSIALTIPIQREAITKAIYETLKVNDIRDGYVRLVVTRGAGSLGLDPHKTSDPQVIIIADFISLYPEKFYQEGLSIVTASTVRTSSASMSPRIKSLNYLNNIMAKLEGMQAGCVEALMLNHKGEIAECTADNIFLVRDGIISTPSKEAGILEGITRQAVLDLAKDAGYDTREVPLTRHDVYIADECFLTGTAAEVVPIVSVDNRKIGSGKPGPVTSDLRERFHALVRN
jgi:branched-chain amino acid aminotransferase